MPRNKVQGYLTTQRNPSVYFTGDCYRQVLPVTSIAVQQAKPGTDTAVQKAKL